MTNNKLPATPNYPQLLFTNPTRLATSTPINYCYKELTQLCMEPMALYEQNMKLS